MNDMHLKPFQFGLAAMFGLTAAAAVFFWIVPETPFRAGERLAFLVTAAFVLSTPIVILYWKT